MITNWQVDFKTDKPKIVLAGIRLTYLPEIGNLFRDFEPIFITRTLEKDLPNNTIVVDYDEESRRNDPRMRQFEFQPLITGEEEIQKLFKEILYTQDKLFIKPYKATRHLTFADPFIDILGPDGQASLKANNKLFQRRNLEGVVEMAQGGLYAPHQLETAFENHANEEGVFLTTGVGGGGSDIRKITSKEQLKTITQELPSNWYIVASWVPRITSSPSVSGIVARDGSTVLLDTVDQSFSVPLCCDGAEYNPGANNHLREELEDNTKKVAREMNKWGYQGFFSVDYFVQDNKKIHFAEINARYTGTTGEIMLAHEMARTEGPTIPEMELHAKEHGTLPFNLQKPPQDLYWGKKTLTAKEDCKVKTETGSYSERKAFEERTGGIFNTYSEGTFIPKGKYVGTVVSVGRTPEQRQRNLDKKIAELESSVEPLN